MNLYSLFAKHFPTQLSQTVIETVDHRLYSYHDLEQQSARFANFLTKQGIKTGDRVIVQIDKSPQAFFLYLAVIRIGAIYLPLNTAYTETELNYFITDAKPSLLVCQPKQENKLRILCDKLSISHCFSLGQNEDGTLLTNSIDSDITFETLECNENEIAAILYTSGTTGKPKGAMISHANLAANAITLSKYWQWTENDVLLHALPLFHIHGLFVACHCVLLSGAKMLWLSSFDANKVFQNLSRATVLMGVPTYYVRLLALKQLNHENCKHMRLFISGSAPLLAQTFNDFHKQTGHEILERYGMTETGIIASNPVDGQRIPGTVGPALPGVSVRIINENNTILPENEVGQLIVKGKNIFQAYWNLTEKSLSEFSDDKYFRTGDLASIDVNGYIQIIGRSKDLIISGGLNIYPKEIEDVLNNIPQVKESAVIGIPHSDFGEAVIAIIVTEDKTDPQLSDGQVLKFLQARLARFKLPKKIHFIDSLPRNTMGKVLKNKLRDDFLNTL